jgi:uncharacterized protein
MPNGNVQIVKGCYQAFLKGDMEGLFGAMAPQIDWESVGREADFPTLGPRRGRDAVKRFFATVAETLDFQTFKAREFHAVGHIVFVMGSYDATVKKTGRRAASEWLHVFWVKEGKVRRFREFTDTASFAEAWRGGPIAFAPQRSEPRHPASSGPPAGTPDAHGIVRPFPPGARVPARPREG